MKKRLITAEELQEKLMQDPQYLELLNRMEAKKLENRMNYAKAAGPFLDALRGHGIEVNDVRQLINSYAPLSKEIVQLILDYLPTVSYDSLIDAMVRALAATKVKYDGNLLAELFDRLDNDSLKWSIGNTFSCTNVQGIEDWLARTLVDERHGKAREMLCIAAGRILPKDQARELLLKVFDQLPGHAAMGLGYCGDFDTIAFLQSKGTDYKTWVKKEIIKCIKKIEKRIERQNDGGRPRQGKDY